MSWNLETVLEFDMDEMQAKAFKLALLWETLSEKEFPNYKHVKLKKKGDPRKSHLFRMCYKLIRDTKGLIPDREYQLYILAQLHVLKNVADNVLVDPNVLVGEKAWTRWKLWKCLYDRNMNNYKKSVNDTNPEVNLSKTTAEFKATKKFFETKFDNSITFEKIKKSLEDHSLVKWVTMQRVSPYYVLLSPWIDKILEGKKWEDVFLFDLTVYKDLLNQEIINAFQAVFNYENI